jgi:hypothetical protein
LPRKRTEYVKLGSGMKIGRILPVTNASANSVSSDPTEPEITVSGPLSDAAMSALATLLLDFVLWEAQDSKEDAIDED